MPITGWQALDDGPRPEMLAPVWKRSGRKPEISVEDGENDALQESGRGPAGGRGEGRVSEEERVWKTPTCPSARALD